MCFALWGAKIGFGVAFIGFSVGALLSAAGKNVKIPQLLIGLSAGLLTVFICFEMLPPVFANGLVKGLVGVLAGIGFAVLLEARGQGRGWVQDRKKDRTQKQERKTMLALVMDTECPAAWLRLRVIHWVICFVMSLPMAIGVLIGSLFDGMPPVLVDLYLSFVAGMMLYTLCGEILPGSGAYRESRWSMLGAGIGFILGVCLWRY